MAIDHSVPQPMDEKEYKILHDILLAAFKSSGHNAVHSYQPKDRTDAANATAHLADALMHLNDRKPR